jgi:uncharacterized protein YecE (DUF72 family)
MPLVPPEATGLDRLPGCAERFTYVEIGSGFDDVPGSKVTAGWARSAAADFMVGIKFHRSMTFVERPDPGPFPPNRGDDSGL